MSTPSITQEELEKVANIYEQIREMYRETDPDVDADLAEALESHLRVSMTELYDRLSEDLPEVILDVYVNRAKNSLYELCSTKLYEYINHIDINIGDLLIQIHQEHHDLFRKTNERCLRTAQENILLKRQIDQGKKETEQVLQNAEELEANIAKVVQEREELENAVSLIRQDYEAHILDLQDENKNYLDKIIKMSKQISLKMPDKNSSHPQPSPKKTKKEKSKEANPFFAIKSVNTSVPAIVKDLTLKQLKDLIEDLYVSKDRYDQICIENHQARETMAQYLQTYLNQKYGLKSLREGWNSVLNRAISKFSQEDTEIALFGKILNSEIEEGFKFSLSQLMSTIIEVLKAILKNKFPLIQERPLKESLSEKVNGELEESEWKGILEYMYNIADSSFLKEVMIELIRHRSLTSRISHRRVAKEPSKNTCNLPFTEFFRILSEFQLESHEKLLSSFRAKFRKIDSDNDGVIDEVGYRTLMDILKCSEHTEKLLDFIDPFENNKINFSDLASKLINEQQGGTSLMQRIYSEIRLE